MFTILEHYWRPKDDLQIMRQAHKVVGLFEEAMGEVQKTSGMNPKVASRLSEWVGD